jgi:hypothetical protein
MNEAALCAASSGGARDDPRKIQRSKGQETMRSPLSVASAVVVFLWAASSVVGCGADGEEVASEVSEASEGIRANALKIGIAGDPHMNLLGKPELNTFFSRTNRTEEFRMIHLYSKWKQSPDSPRALALEDQIKKAARPENHTEVLVSFEASCTNAGSDNTCHAWDFPEPHSFESAFVDFRNKHPTVKRYIAWNEPNGVGALSNTDKTITARWAADYYLAARKHCPAHPGDDCVVTAGDFRAWFDWDVDDFTSKHDPDDPRCCDTPFMERYKYWLDRDSENWLGRKHHRPEVWSIHPYWDVDQYTNHGKSCGTDCLTDRFRRQLAGSWAKTEIWATEVGALHTNDHEQSCATAFLLRVLARDPRITRLYYFTWIPWGPDRGLFDWPGSPDKVRPVFDQLRDHTTQLANCRPETVDEHAR